MSEIGPELGSCDQIRSLIGDIQLDALSLIPDYRPGDTIALSMEIKSGGAKRRIYAVLGSALSFEDGVPVPTFSVHDGNRRDDFALFDDELAHQWIDTGWGALDRQGSPVFNSGDENSAQFMVDWLDWFHSWMPHPQFFAVKHPNPQVIG